VPHNVAVVVHSLEYALLAYENLKVMIQIQILYKNIVRGPWSASELYRLSDRHLTAKFSAELTPLQIHSLSDNRVALGIEPGTCGSVGRNSDH
jgi:hypothetical protein